MKGLSLTMPGDAADQELLDQQVLTVLEFVMGAETKFASPLPDDVLRLQQRILRSASSVPGYSVSNPLEFYRVLRIFGRRDSPTMGEIGDALSVSLSTATRVVNFLEKNGWAKRRSDAIDGRRIRVTLTEKGQEALTTISQFLIQCHREILSYLTPQERLILTTLLDKLAKCFAP